MQHIHSSLKVETDHEKRTGQFLKDVEVKNFRKVSDLAQK